MKKRTLLVILGLVVSSFIACDKEIPINEFSDARNEISKARSVKAELYSPREFQSASKDLNSAHEMLVKEEKPEEATKLAVSSFESARVAYDKSLVLYSKDVLDKAAVSVGNADVAYAEKLAPSSFQQAKDLIIAATDKYENKEYEESIKLSLEAQEKALQAKRIALGNRSELEAKINMVKSVLSKVESYDGYEQYSSNEYGEAKSYLEKAEQAYSADNLKKGFGEVELAKLNADKAYESVLKGVASKKIEVAAGIVQKADGNKGAEVSPEDMAAAKEALENAKQYEAEKNYLEAITYADEAVRLGNIVIQACESANKEKEKITVASKVKKKKSSGSDKYYYYKVKSRTKYKDCLWRIAQKYYKNPRLWRVIHRANKGRIKNPNFIKPGWIIRVPKRKK